MLTTNTKKQLLYSYELSRHVTPFKYHVTDIVINIGEESPAAKSLVSNVYVSVLQANDYTVEIDKRPGLDESLDTIHLTLLTKQRAHERLKTYSAPLEIDLP